LLTAVFKFAQRLKLRKIFNFLAQPLCIQALKYLKKEISRVAPKLFYVLPSPVMEGDTKMYEQGRYSEGRNIRLMVVEDDPGVGYAVSRWLQDQNIRSVLATSTHEAVEMLRDVIFIESTFDGLLVDYNLPDENGFKVIEQFRDEFPYMPVALMSGSDAPHLLEWAKDHKVPLFAKPLKLDALGSWLESLKQIA